MANVLNWLKQTNSPSRNGYDVSRRNTFSMPCAMIEPCLVRDFPMDTDNKISLDSIINTTPLVNQPFTRGQFVVDFYQVPYSMLYSDFNQFYTQTVETFSSATDIEHVLDNVPQLNMTNLLLCIAYDYFFYQVYPPSSTLENDSFDVPDLEKFGYLVGSALGVDIHGYPRCFGAIRLLDMLGYGNFLPFLKWVATDANLNPEGSVSRDPSTQKWYDYFETPYVYALACVGLYVDYLKGRDSLDTPNIVLSTVGEIIVSESQSQIVWQDAVGILENLQRDQRVFVNPLRLQAYQKIFNDIYINTFYEKPSPIAYSSDNIDYGAPFYFDDITSSSPVPNLDLPSSLALIEIHYRQFKKDMFTSLLPNSQLGDVAITPVGTDDTISIAALGTNLRSTVRVGSDGKVEAAVPYPSGGTQFAVNGLSFSVLQNRRAEAVQKYKERYLRAGSRVKDQFKSSWGQVPYYLEDHYCRYLGSMSSQLNLQAVPATNDTGNYNIGERASYGYSQIKDTISFNSKDFGMVMALCYFLPEMDYPAFGIEEPNLRQEWLDYPVPEFENLGLQPVTRAQLNSFGTYIPFDSTQVDPERPVNGNEPIGYGPAYLYHKTDVDKLHGEFCSYNDKRGLFASWVTTRGQVSMRYLSDYYCDPTYLNSIFVSQYNGMQSSDQFLMCLNFNYNVVEGLSVVGLPLWN